MIVKRSQRHGDGDGDDDKWEDDNCTNDKANNNIMAPLSPCTDDKENKMTPLDIEANASEPQNISDDAHENCCSKRFQYGGLPEAKGYALLAMGRGAAVMSNGASIFYSLPQ